MKHFSKVLSSTQSHSPQPLGAVEKLELPNNRKEGEREAGRVFRLFELFDRGEGVRGDQDEASTLPSPEWCWLLRCLSNAPAYGYQLAARIPDEGQGGGGVNSLEVTGARPDGPHGAHNRVIHRGGG